MARIILIVAVIGTIIASIANFFPGIENVQASASPVDAVAKQQILDATIHIMVYANDGSENISSTQAVAQYAVGDGLGTLVQDGADSYIVTHDHWSRLVGDMHKVQLRNAEGELLMELDRFSFYSLIRYRDGGTMVLEAPEQITAHLTAVPVAKNGSFQNGQSLLIAFWQPDADEKITVEPVSVEMVETYEGQPAVKLSSLNGKIVVHGNSGGGVFANGQLVANMWQTIVQQHLVNGESTGETSTTNLSRAAVTAYEIEGADELTPVAGGQAI